ncbi:MAG: hypothetical protein IPH30_13570 [Betaproteobacteria bacterium]|nr:hypothetical protein [Betaproteobacteria bacterium]
MKRWAFGILAVLALAGGGVYWFVTSLDFIVKTAIERFGPDMLGTTVSVEQVSISTADGRGTIRAIAIGNPPGYSARSAASRGDRHRGA